MNVKERTDKLFGKDKGEGKAVEGIVGLMKYFGWTLQDVRELSVPSYFVIVETVNKIEKDAEAKSKRKR